MDPPTHMTLQLQVSLKIGKSPKCHGYISPKCYLEGSNNWTQANQPGTYGFSQALILGASVAAAPSGSQPGCQGGADEQIFVWKHYGMWFSTGSWMLLVPK